MKIVGIHANIKRNKLFVNDKEIASGEVESPIAVNKKRTVQDNYSDCVGQLEDRRKIKKRGQMSNRHLLMGDKHNESMKPFLAEDKMDHALDS